MEYIIRRWYLFSVYIAGVFALILGIGNWDQQSSALLLGMIFINVHFFEEFGLPGGFAWGGLKVEKNQSILMYQNGR